MDFSKINYNGLFGLAGLADSIYRQSTGNGLLGDILDATHLSNLNTSDLYSVNKEWAMEQAQKQMDFQTSANKIAMDFESAEADKARAWQAEMTNSAYQRAVEDLKRAGLNPILAYSQGGAAVPSVSSASGVTSAGSKASMADTGYKSADQESDRLEMLVNSATRILGALGSFLK